MLISGIHATDHSFLGLVKGTKTILGTRFSEFAARYARDPRFLIIEKMRERENLFFGYKKKAQKKKEQDEAERKEKIKNNFE